MNPEENQFSRLDLAFSGFLAKRIKPESTDVRKFETLMARLSNGLGHGHSCIELEAQDRQSVLASGLVAEVESLSLIDHQTTPVAPLVLEQNRLYLQRYWYYEFRLARQIAGMLDYFYAPEKLAETLDRYFVQRVDEVDWQREAARLAIERAFCMISGGPGTGKTTTVVKILALLQELAERPLHIGLAAPTGKAAMRLQESIGLSKSRLPCAEAVKNHIPETVVTLHRLLGAEPPSPYFHHDADRPLPFDVVVVDEASMVDLALMSKLVDALKPGSRLILLGDKDQLASVESGVVLADLTSTLPAYTAELKKSYRFDENIKKFADAVNQQQTEEAWQLLLKGENTVEHFKQGMIDYIVKQRQDYLGLIRAGSNVEAVFKAFHRFQVLCATRQGPNSVADINYRVERQLENNQQINITGAWYVGRPVMVTRNNSALQLYNGDIGICLNDNEQKEQLMVYFQRPDGSIKKILPTRVPGCQTVFAMTIHKSQGSEFDEVLIVLPDQQNPIMSKELLYTAITRAKQSVKLAVSQSVFNGTVARKIKRQGGLAAKLSA